MEYDDAFNGITSWNAIFHTKDGRNTTKFNNWKFTSTLYWDSVEQGFWFDANTTLLTYTNEYVLGK